jgi:predicted O-methyltransferase YrrM
MSTITQLAVSFEFSEDWFSNHVPSWRTILERLRPSRVLEIGSYEGRSTSFLIDACSRFGPLQLTSVDTWAGSVDLAAPRMAGVERRFDHNVALAISQAAAPVRFTKYKERSTIALARFIADGVQPFDFIYVDGSHTAPDVLTDAVLAFQLLRVGGVMVFDDYLWSMESPLNVDPLNMPKPAIDAFAMLFMRKVRVLPDLPNAQCVVEKIAA